MVQYVLDTDTIIDVLRGIPPVVRRLAGVSPDDVGVASMTVAELRYGALVSRDPARSLAETARLLEQLTLLAFGARAAALHGDIRYALRGRQVGPHDLVIAATALAAGAAIVTSNTREFERVPELRVESWRVGR